MGCGSGDTTAGRGCVRCERGRGSDFDTEEVPGGTLGYTEIEGEQAALGKQAALGESVTLDAGIMKGPVGSRPWRAVLS